jgi:4-diphosphocytidyl-2-C-methyl-D-erythritol kinase
VLAERRRELAAALEHGAALPAAPALLHNDLQRAALSLCPQIAQALHEARDAGADRVMVSGSGPTVVGIFPPGGGSASDGPARAEHAAATLRDRTPAAIPATPVDAAFGRVLTVDGTARGA